MGRRNTPAISLEMDFEDGYEALGFMAGMTETMKTTRYVGSVLEMSHAILAREFDQTMDQLAMSMKSSFHHVYEWRMIGLPEGRLWRHTLVGRGANREASFEWIASSAPILTPEERMDDPLGINDPMQMMDPEVMEKYKDRSYFFYWKAPMMEYNLTARVRPRYAKRLLVPSWRARGNYFYTMETYQDFSRANPQDGSGGPGVSGKFTAAFTGWWSNAEDRWGATVREVIENDIGITAREIAAKSKRARTKTFTLKKFGGGDYHFAAYESGRNRAEALVMGQAKSYAQQAKYIEKNGLFGVDVAYAD